VSNSSLAQVVGKFDLSTSTRNDQIQILLKWDNREEEKWKIDNSPKLEVMSVSIGLSSSQFTTNQSFVAFSFVSDQYSKGEYLVSVDRFHSAEFLEIRSKTTDEILHTISLATMGKFLTPVFSNED